MRKLVVSKKAMEELLDLCWNINYNKKQNIQVLKVKLNEEIMSVEGTTDKHDNGEYVLWSDLLLVDIHYVVTDNQVKVTMVV